MSMMQSINKLKWFWEDSRAKEVVVSESETFLELEEIL